VSDSERSRTTNYEACSTHDTVSSTRSQTRTAGLTVMMTLLKLGQHATVQQTISASPASYCCERPEEQTLQHFILEEAHHDSVQHVAPRSDAFLYHFCRDFFCSTKNVYFLTFIIMRTTFILMNLSHQPTMKG